MKTGAAPVYAIALQVAMKVKGCVMTRSFGPTPVSIRAVCKAAVPFTTATACGAPVMATRSCSKAVISAPTEETKVDRTHAATAISSASSNQGACKGTVPLS